MARSDLLNLFRDRIVTGLQRKSALKCSKWAEKYRVMGPPFPGKWGFRYHPWLREMHDSEAEFNYGQKAAQVGYSETVLNVTLFNIDVKGLDVLYVLPAKTPDASDFSSSRFDPALELSPHLSSLFSDVKNVGHKRAGNANLFIRGSRSRSGLKSIPTGVIILDELEEMDQKNIPLALERSAGQVEKLNWMVSTPRLPGMGINKYFVQSTQEHFFFPCPKCSRWTELVFPQCLEITADSPLDPEIENSFFKCRECQEKLDHQTKSEWLAPGKWVPAYTNRCARGFRVNQMYSSTVAGVPGNLAKKYLSSLRDRTEEQEFYNSNLGLEHQVEGSSVTDPELDRAIKSYKKGTEFRGIITMGIDVGKWLHYEVDLWHLIDGVGSTDLNIRSSCKVIDFGKLLHFEQLDDIMKKFGVRAAVIDANPERRKAFEFAMRFFGLVKLCFYGQGCNGKQININKEEESTITVDRTSWLDLSLGRFKNIPQTISLPIDTNLEYRQHIKCPIRSFEKDHMGNPVGRYESGSDDHYAHARNYAEIALPFALSLAVSKDIG